MNGAEFERLLAHWLEERGYAVREAPKAADAGFDFAVVSPEHGGLVIVEAKRLNRQGHVSVESVRQLLSAIPMVGAVAGLLISTSG